MAGLLLKYIFVILHIITAAGWFGLSLRLAGQARLALALEPAAAAAVADDTRRTVRLVGIFIVLTFVFGLIAFFIGGGFGGYGPQYHTSLLLIVIAIGLHYGLVRPAWSRLRSAVTGAGAATGEADAARKRVAMGVGIGHLIWLVLLVLMFWNQLRASL